MADTTIEIIKNGPYIVKGEVELKDAERARATRSKANGALPLRRLDGEAVLRWHTLEDWFRGGGEGRAGISGKQQLSRARAFCGR